MLSYVTGFAALFETSGPAWSGPWRRAAAMLDAWRTRRVLAELEPRQLKDIGVSLSEARMEIARAPWDIDLRR